MHLTCMYCALDFFDTYCVTPGLDNKLHCGAADRDRSISDLHMFPFWLDADLE